MRNRTWCQWVNCQNGATMGTHCIRHYYWNQGKPLPGEDTLFIGQDQPTLPAPTGRQLKKQGMDQVDANADPLWKQHAMTCITQLCTERDTLTADDVWEALDAGNYQKPHEPKAMGAIFRTAAARRLIESTDQFVESRRPEAHARAIRVWRCL